MHIFSAAIFLCLSVFPWLLPRESDLAAKFQRLLVECPALAIRVSLMHVYRIVEFAVYHSLLAEYVSLMHVFVQLTLYHFLLAGYVSFNRKHIEYLKQKTY